VSDMEPDKTSRAPEDFESPLVRIPRRLLFVSLGIALLAPYLARLPGVFSHGPDWLISYLPNPASALFVAGLSLIPGIALYLIGKLSRKSPLAFWGAVAGSTGFALWAHGSMNLAASSTAAIGLLFIPVYCLGYAIAGAVIGWIVQKSIQPEPVRRLIAWAACVGAVIVPLGSVLQDQAEIVQRESKFPTVSVREIPLVKRTVYGCCEIGRIEDLALGNFDSEPGQEVALLGGDFNVVLDAATYAVKSKTRMAKLECDRCVGMYSRIAADGGDSFVVASSDGVVDKAGQILWRLDHSSFTKIAALLLPNEGGLTFFSSEIPSQIKRHDARGAVLWTFEGPVSHVEIFEKPDGERLPAATISTGNSSELWVFSLDGKISQKIALPKWANQVTSVAWPSRGNILAGSRSWIGVLDAEGKQVLLHQIEGTSFNPYHGPDGVAVRFDRTAGPYLAVMSHGSSGYARSVLLVFDPQGRLVWQEELNKLRAILAVPRADGRGEVLLVGGMDGVTEYKLDAASASKR
jgi:hypothetical protein